MCESYMTGTLYIVATPIGNLTDVTLRAIETLKSVDLIACEDTRHTRILLDRYGIATPVTSYYEYNKVTKTEHLLKVLREGRSVALVSDAGTPGISDPGAVIVRRAIDEGIPLTVIPGPAAFVAALVVSGKPTAAFTFEGFLPVKPGARKKRLEALKAEGRTAVLYESPHRIEKLLSAILEVYGDAEVALARELTKKFEEVRRGRVSDLLRHVGSRGPKGEYIVVL